ncbi:unnamed protein product [Auanema sp. JU1783]|nr:unnamed protein product [Auanema sp. JU1783]
MYLQSSQAVMKLFLCFVLFTTCGAIHFHSRKDYTKWDWNRLMSELTHALKYYHLEELLPSLDLRDVNLTNSCRDDLMFLTDSITDLLREFEGIMKGNKTEISPSGKLLALPMLDSSSKIGPGILRGHIHFLGFLPQCIKVKVYLDLPSFQTNSCIETYDCPSLDLCLPHSCKNDELTPLFRSIKTGKWKNQVRRAEHINANIPPPDVGTFIILSLFLVLLASCLLSSVIDCFWLSKEKDTIGNYSKLIMAFSYHRNVKEIFTVSISQEDHIPVLHCMRFLSIAWVIAAHTYGFLSLVVKNPLDQLDTVHHGYWTAFYANGFPAVDTFFYMSGLLLSYLWFKEFRRNRSRTMSLKAWSFFYIHRFIRLSPAYYLTLLFYTFVFSRWYTNMPVLTLSEIQNDTCRDQWWINVLYLNNFISQEKMVGYQKERRAFSSVLLFLVLIPFAFSGYFGGLTVAVVFISTSIGLSFYQVYHWSFPPLLYRLDAQHKDVTDDYQFWMYYQPYIRCQPYIVGIIVGYYLQFTRRLIIPKVLNCFAYVFSFGLFFAIVFGVNALYNSLAKLGWSLALTWLTISCHYNNGGAVQSFMSWWIWIPLGRLSFCAYLIHIPLTLFVWGLDKYEKVYSGELDAFINIILPSIFYSFGMAVFWKALVEMPFSKMEFFFLQRWGKESSFVKESSMNKQTVACINSCKVSVINKDFTQL